MSAAEDIEAFQTVAWVGDAAGGHCASLIRRGCRPNSSRSTVMTLRPCGRPSNCFGFAELRPLVLRPATGRSSAPVARVCRRGDRGPSAARGDSLPAHQSADRREPVLGPRPDGCDRNRGRGQRWQWASAARPAIGRGPRHRRRGPGHVPGNRPSWRRACCTRRRNLDPLQRRRPGHLGLRNGPGCDLLGARAGQAHPSVRRRDAATTARGAR